VRFEKARDTEAPRASCPTGTLEPLVDVVDVMMAGMGEAAQLEGGQATPLTARGKSWEGDTRGSVFMFLARCCLFRQLDKRPVRSQFG